MIILNSDLVLVISFNISVKQSSCSNFSRLMVALRSIRVAKPYRYIDPKRLLHNHLDKAVFSRFNRDLKLIG
jgi:hypothetical protein